MLNDDNERKESNPKIKISVDGPQESAIMESCYPAADIPEGGAAMSLGSAFSKIGSKLGSALSSKAGRLVTTGAAVGGGSYVALTGVGAGIENIADATGISTIADFLTGNGDGTPTSGKGVGTLLGVGVLVGLALLAVFVIIPRLDRVKRHHD